jgi:hypothetical protein
MPIGITKPVYDAGCNVGHAGGAKRLMAVSWMCDSAAHILASKRRHDQAAGCQGSTYFMSIFGSTLLVAAGIGLAFPTLNAIATSNVPSGDMEMAAGNAGTSSQVGGAIGLAVLASAAGTKAMAGLVDQSKMDQLAAGYAVAFLIAASISAAIALTSLLVPRRVDAL